MHGFPLVTLVVRRTLRRPPTPHRDSSAPRSERPLSEGWPGRRHRLCNVRDPAVLPTGVADCANRGQCSPINMCHKRIGFCMAVDAFNKRKTRIGHLGEPLPSPDRSVDAGNSVELASSLHDGVSTSVTKKPSAARRAAVRVGTDQSKPGIPMPAHRLQRPLRNTASQGRNVDGASLSWPGVRRPAATIQCRFDIASFAPADAAFISRRTRGNPGPRPNALAVHLEAGEWSAHPNDLGSPAHPRRSRRGPAHRFRAAL
jgi:hypothetical protein